MALFDGLLKKAEQTLKQNAADLMKKGAAQVKTNLSCEKKDITFQSIPRTVEEMKALPNYTIQDPFTVAALTVAALTVFSENQEEGIALLNELKGPEKLTPMGIANLKDRLMDGKDYIARSYFEGATPKNNYEPNKPYKIRVEENPYSKQNYEEGYLVLHVTSGGADTPRPITLRKKNSTGEWFLFGEFMGLLAGIRIPEAADPWA